MNFLFNNLPYLNVAVHETLRMHPPLLDISRAATVDDVIPLSKHVRTRSDKVVARISITKATYVFR